MKTLHGFTLVELIVVVALVAIIATVAVPNFAQLIESNRVTSHANSVVGAMSYARAEAVRRGQTVAVVPVGGDYANGLSVQAGGGELRRVEPPPTSITLAMTNGAAMTFRANGMSGQNVEIRYRVCGDPGSDGTLISVSLGGQVRTADTVCP